MLPIKRPPVVKIAIFCLLFTLLPSGYLWAFPAYNPDTDYCGPKNIQGKVKLDQPFISVNFKHACYLHDKCYSECNLYCTSQAACDKAFHEDMKSVCAKLPHLKKPECLQAANGYYNAVSQLAGPLKAFKCGDMATRGNSGQSAVASNTAKVFEHKDFRGVNFSINKGDHYPDLTKVSAGGKKLNDIITAIRIGDGLRCEFYQHIRYEGKKLGPLCPGDYPDLTTDGWNDKISSMKCEAAPATGASTGQASAGNVTITSERPPQQNNELVVIALCTLNIAPSGKTYKADETAGSFSVRPDKASCIWSAKSTANWMTLDAASEKGRGTQTVNFTLSGNTGSSSRTGTIVVWQGVAPASASRLTKTFTVTQKGSTGISIQQPSGAQATTACFVHPSKEILNVRGRGESVTLTVNAPAQCSWTVGKTPSWIKLKSSPDGRGNGRLSLSVERNKTHAFRTFHLHINDRVVLIRQAPGL